VLFQMLGGVWSCSFTAMLGERGRWGGWEEWVRARR
jgi:hypothetical protein